MTYAWQFRKSEQAVFFEEVAFEHRHEVGDEAIHGARTKAFLHVSVTLGQWSAI